MGLTTTYSKLWFRISPLFLGLSWMLGMILGYVCSDAAQDQTVLLVRQSISAVPSMVGAVSVVLLPYLLSALAVSICEPWLILVISTFKAFSFTFCAWGVCLAFGQSSWLALFLFLFSDLCLIPALYLFWLRSIRGERISGWGKWLFLAYALFVFVLDYWLIGPFLRVVLE